MQKVQMMYEGKAKKAFRNDDDRYAIVSYMMHATASNGQARLWCAGTIKCPTISRCRCLRKRRED